MLTDKSPRRRQLRYRTLDDLRIDVDFCAQHSHITVGNWSYRQILTHLYRFINGSFDGFSFKAPLPLRISLRLIRKRVLNRPIPAGFKMSKGAVVLNPTDAPDLSTAVEEMQKAILRLEDHVPEQEHPVFGRLNYDEWVLCHLRHAELHMSFVVPRQLKESNE